MSKMMMTTLAFCCLSLVACGGQTQSSEMSGETLAELIQKFDEDAKVQSNGVQFTLNERELFMVFDAKADRMRIITPIAQAGLANEEVLTLSLIHISEPTRPY